MHIKFIFLILIVCLALIIGFLSGYYLGPHSATAIFFQHEISKHFGIITQHDKDYEVIGSIGWKDLSFPVIMENGVKTIRAYRYIEIDN